MNQLENYLIELEGLLPDTVNKAAILREYWTHMEEMQQAGLTSDEIINKLGDPAELAATYKENTTISRGFVQRNFMFCNCLFFIIGGLLTLSYHLFNFQIFSSAWHVIMNVPFVIMISYTAFWLLLGYEIGKEYGYRGSRLLSKTVLLSIMPNLFLMFLTLFQIIPTRWFDPLLSPPFVVICVIMTMLFYPISRLGYKIGIYYSV